VSSPIKLLILANLMCIRSEPYFAESSHRLLSALKAGIMREKVSSPGWPSPKGGRLPALKAFPLGPSGTNGLTEALVEGRRKVREEFKTSNLPSWSVAYLSVGVASDEAVPAIVAIHPDLDTLKKTSSILNQCDVEYLIEKGSLLKHSSIVSALQTFQDEPMNGSSIGWEGSDKSWGSLGGYLRLGDDTVIAMTCGHVLGRDKKANTTTMICVQPAKCHFKDNKPDDSRVHMGQISPSGADIGAGTGHRFRGSDSDFLSRLSLNQTVKHSSPASDALHYFGTMISTDTQASMNIDTKAVLLHVGQGLSAQEIAVSMDWAILRKLSRESRQNTVHDKTIKGWKSLVYSINRWNDVQVGASQKVYMQGARSGQSQGYLMTELMDCYFEGNSRPTAEIGIIGHDGKDFSGPGDSGSWIVEHSESGHGYVVGVLLGGYHTGIICVSVMTPIEHVLRDTSEKLEVDIGSIRLQCA
jgi:hypothetical protein